MEKNNMIESYKNTQIELSVLDEREKYLIELLKSIEKKKNNVKENCIQQLWVYFGKSCSNVVRINFLKLIILS